MIDGNNCSHIHTRAFPPRSYTCRGSIREVTRVKKDVRVNLARCISGDELIPPISLWFSISVAFCLLLSFFFFLPYLSFSPVSSWFPLAKCTVRLFSLSPLYFHPSLWSMAILTLVGSHYHPLASSSLSMADLTNLENHVSRDVY